MILRILVNTANLNINKQTARVVRVYNRNVPNGITENAFTAKGDLLVGTGDGTYIAVAAGTDGEYLVFDSTQPAGIRTETPTITVDDTTNHLINGGFNFAQRQAPGTLTTIADLGYGADRWKQTRENADLQYIRVDGSSESGLTSPYYGQYKKITNSGKILICQPLEYLDTLKFRGKTVNFQLQMKASAAKTIKIAVVELRTGGTADTLPTLVSSWGADGTDPTLGANLATIGTPTTCSVTTSWQTFQFTGSFPTTSKNLIVMVWSNADFAANDTLSLAEAGLYFGASTRTWTPIPSVQDLQLCRRYYWKTFDTHTAPAQAVSTASYRFIAGKAGATAQYAAFLLPVAMRIAPTCTGYNHAAANSQARDGTAAADCSSTTVVAEGNTIYINTTGNASTAVGNRLHIHITADAEL